MIEVDSLPAKGELTCQGKFVCCREARSRGDARKVKIVRRGSARPALGDRETERAARGTI